MTTLVGASKGERYDQLVEARKRCDLCAELCNPSRVEGGRLDSNHIGPYTRWHYNLNAKVVVVGKDFAPVSKFIEFQGWPGVDVDTNERLVNYVRHAGFTIDAPRQALVDSDLFFTNAVLCLPPGQATRERQMRTFVSNRNVSACARAFLKDTIELVSPSCSRHSRRAGYGRGSEGV